MAGYYDPFGRSMRQPSQLDYRQLVQAYQNLQAEYERAALMVRQQEAVLQKQAKRLAQLEGELQQAREQLARREAAPQTKARIAAMEEQLEEARIQRARLETALEQARATQAGRPTALAPGRATDLEAQPEQARELRSQLEAAVEDLDARARAAEGRAARLDAELQQATDQLRQLEARLAASQQQPAASQDDEDWRDRYLRLQAELDNFKRRQERRYAHQAEEDRQRILLDMLPVADHLELGLRHWRQQPKEAQVGATHEQNMRATLQAFLDSLRRYGVERIDALGQPFDPQLHEGIGYAPSETAPEGTVAEIVQPGYTENGRLLRPARVLISSGQD